jgi:hypothetical protein
MIFGLGERSEPFGGEAKGIHSPQRGGLSKAPFED